MNGLRSAALAAAVASGLSWTAAAQITPLFAPASATGDGFGASLALDGQRLVVGASVFYGLGWLGTQELYVHVRSPSGWTLEQILPPTASAFGADVALDGERIVVGAPGDAGEAGAVLVYDRTPTGWVETAQLFASDAAPKQYFGSHVALEGDRLVALDLDAAYVFELVPGGWAETALLRAVDGVPLSSDVALSGDTVVAGASSDSAGGTWRGSAYVFERAASGWSQTAKLVPPNSFDLQRFGFALDLDGDRVAIGAPAHALVGEPGAVHELVRGPGGWSEVARIDAPLGALAVGFGSSVALAGTTLVVGSPSEPAQPGLTGSAYAYVRAPSGWQLESELDDPAPAPSSRYGDRVACDGNAAAVGAPSTLFGSAGHVGTLELGARLWGTPVSLSVAAGGAQSLALDAPPATAGLVYLVLGSVSGTSPGLVVDDALVPLVVDSYTVHTLGAPSTGPLFGSLGLLDANGDAFATFVQPAVPPPALVGLTAWHAAVVLDPFPPGPVVRLASNAAPLAFTP